MVILGEGINEIFRSSLNSIFASTFDEISFLIEEIILFLSRREGIKYKKRAKTVKTDKNK